MVYCFDRDFHGEVVADQHAAGLHSYLGHHFPAKDIPPQARALYVLNRTRIIPDARYRPEPLVPDIRPDTAVPIDLSHSTLRSVSPTHCEYMANMGIVASMSISIVSDGQLAAMIICHHRTPHFVPYRLRQTLELLARAVASRIAMLDRRSIEAVTEIVERAYNSIGPSTKRRGAGAVLEILGLPLLELMKSSGLALLSATNSVRIGETPNAAAIEEVVRAIRERHDVGVFTSERMSDLYTSERKSAFACGVMALQLPRSQEWLIWFRPEWEHTRIWAGNPNEQALSNGKINPRHSFADWKEIVLGQSRPWDEIDIAAARKLASLIG
jgi:light-regulated signal transduction histidine kinase (bacteriophytochrome)